MPREEVITPAGAMGGPVDDADDGGMTKTRPFPVRFLVAAAVSGLALVAVGCGSSSPKATPASNKTTTASPAAEPVDSPYCQTARKWQVHELNGAVDAMLEVALEFSSAKSTQLAVEIALKKGIGKVTPHGQPP